MDSPVNRRAVHPQAPHRYRRYPKGKDDKHFHMPGIMTRRGGGVNGQRVLYCTALNSSAKLEAVMEDKWLQTVDRITE